MNFDIVDVVMWSIFGVLILLAILLLRSSNNTKSRKYRDLSDSNSVVNDESIKMLDHNISEKTRLIQNKLKKTKERLNTSTDLSDKPVKNDGNKCISQPSKGPVTLKELAGEITKEELLEDRKRVQQATNKIDHPDKDFGKTTLELLDEFEQRNNIPSVQELELELIKYDGKS